MSAACPQQPVAPVPAQEATAARVRAVAVRMPLRLGTVNCYVVRAGAGFVLVDTGSANGRGALDRALAEEGCGPGALRLIVLTHGDFDHIGNAAYLRATLGARIAMHRDDAGMAEQGDMFHNRTSGDPLLRRIAPLLFRFPTASRFTPDLFLDEGDTLLEHGLDARVLSIPGHSKGSIGILTADGDLFCGDLMENVKKPSSNSIMDDPAAGEASLKRLRGLAIRTVYPGHGMPFTW